MAHHEACDAGQAPVGLAALVPAENGMVLEPSLPRGRLPDLEHVEEVDERQSEPPDPADWEKNVGNVFEYVGADGHAAEDPQDGAAAAALDDAVPELADHDAGAPERGAAERRPARGFAAAARVAAEIAAGRRGRRGLDDARDHDDGRLLDDHGRRRGARDHDGYLPGLLDRVRRRRGLDRVRRRRGLLHPDYRTREDHRLLLDDRARGHGLAALGLVCILPTRTP